MIRKKGDMGILFIFILFAHGLMASSGSPGLGSDKRITQNKSGLIDTTLHSKVLGEERRIIIQLPKEYKESELTSYPVLYILDAEGGHGWLNAVTTIEELSTSETIPEMILVGIHNTDRNRDMIPEKVAHRPGSGGSDHFLRFITHELNAFVESHYRTTRFTILYGGSNAGLFTVYAMLKPQVTIQAGIAASPMIGHCSDFIVNKVEQLLQGHRIKARTLFMIYGDKDSKRVVDYIPKFYGIITSRAADLVRSKLVILENEGHVPPMSLRLGLVEIFNHEMKPLEVK